MFEATFRNFDDTLCKDAGCSSEPDYIELISWMLHLNYLADFEADGNALSKGGVTRFDNDANLY
jgi:type I restriction enzyme M protein